MLNPPTKRQDLIDFVQTKVPLIPTETAHQWVPVVLHGCGVCGKHDGYECRLCHRVIDEEGDTALFVTVRELLKETP